MLLALRAAPWQRRQHREAATMPLRGAASFRTRKRRFVKKRGFGSFTERKPRLYTLKKTFCLNVYYKRVVGKRLYPVDGFWYRFPSREDRIPSRVSACIVDVSERIIADTRIEAYRVCQAYRVRIRHVSKTYPIPIHSET